MSVLEKATAHFTDLMSRELQHIEVPEWVVDGKPVKIYFKPAMNFRALSKILRWHKEGQDEEALVQTIIIRALDGSGKNMFKDTDMETLMREVDPFILRRIIDDMDAQKLEVDKELKKT